MTLPNPQAWTEDSILEWCTRCDRCKRWRLRARYHEFHGPHAEGDFMGCWWRECMDCSFATVTRRVEELGEKEGS